MNKHRAKCDVLKKIRKGIADKLGIDLRQGECTFEGECKGTCPKCRQEEDILNREIARRAGALALGATVSFTLTACAPGSNGIPEELDGNLAPDIMDVAGNLMPAEDEFPVDDGLTGEPIPPQPTTGESVFEMQGDIVYEEEGEPAEEYEEAEDEEAENSPIPEVTLGEIPYDGAD